MESRWLFLFLHDCHLDSLFFDGVYDVDSNFFLLLFFTLHRTLRFFQLPGDPDLNIVRYWEMNAESEMPLVQWPGLSRAVNKPVSAGVQREITPPREEVLYIRRQLLLASPLSHAYVERYDNPQFQCGGGGVGCGGTAAGEEGRVRESGSGDRVDPLMGIIFGLRRKNPAGKLFRRRRYSGRRWGEWWPDNLGKKRR
ncbi:hypothetical protein Tco_0991759 [Tanacetum coccineum]|uniref:Uncharacterized protein n=1 Tax=Tanacetum coccineum TaxID=301880 RepID=A0ABQ5F0E2_9ASTR